MRRRLSGPKTSFFAFQDIITSVTGVLILVTLLLASHLEEAADSPAAPDADQQRRLQELLREQTRLQSESLRVAGALATAEAVPETSRLQADNARLVARIEAEASRGSQSEETARRQREEVRQRDERLGLAALARDLDQADAQRAELGRQEAAARAARDAAAQQIKRLENILLQVRSRQGQLWVLPDNLTSTKEPLLAVVDANGVTLERFNQPQSKQSFAAMKAPDGFAKALGDFKTSDFYVVFYIRPSGVGLFDQLVYNTRKAGFEVGYDSLDEGVLLYFSKPPPIIEPSPADGAGAGPVSSGSVAGGSAASAPNGTAASTARASGLSATNAPIPRRRRSKLWTLLPPPPAPSLSWWQWLLRAVGIF